MHKYVLFCTNEYNALICFNIEFPHVLFNIFAGKQIYLLIFLNKVSMTRYKIKYSYDNIDFYILSNAFAHNHCTNVS